MDGVRPAIAMSGYTTAPAACLGRSGAGVAEIVHDPAMPIPIELGAEFVHGKPQEIWEIVREENLVMGSLEGDDWCSENHALKKCNDFWPRWNKVARLLKRGKSYPRQCG